MKRLQGILIILMVIAGALQIPTAHAAYAFTSHTFTPCGASGISGPTQAQCTSAYSTTWDDNSSNFSVTGGIQLWTVPGTGKYRLEIAGSSSPLSGRGNIIRVLLADLRQPPINTRQMVEPGRIDPQALRPRQ